jgi:hypothetical protein
MQHAQRSLARARRQALPVALVATLGAGVFPAPAFSRGLAPQPVWAAPVSPVPAPELVGGPVEWQRSAAFAGLGEASAVAVDAAGSRVAAGDEDGAWLLEGEGHARRVAAPGPVRDLAFGPDGTLWIAGDEGLFALDPEGRLHERTPAPGEAERQVRRVVAVEGLVLCGTAGGAFASTDGQAWTRLDAEVPDGDVTALALRDRTAGATPQPPAPALDLWLIVDGEVLRAELHTAARLEADAVSRPPLPPSAFPAVDLIATGAAFEVALLAEGSLALLREEGWETRRPELPAGAVARRLAYLAGRLWIATDAGLLEERNGRFVRAFGPAGSDAVSTLAGAGGRVLAAGARGILEGVAQQTAAPAEPGPPAPWEDPAAGEPEVLAVQRAALRYLDLHPSRVHAMRRRLNHAGWLPTLRITGNHGGRRVYRQDWDEAFTGGDYRFLYDRALDRTRDFSAQLQLTWDLGDVVYAPRSVELSRESRELTKLRDQILAQVVQLYFARRRVLLDLAAHAAPEGLEAERLRLRADELAAGLDAWTGGWWSQHVPPLERPGPGASPAASGPPRAGRPPRP